MFKCSILFSSLLKKYMSNFRTLRTCFQLLYFYILLKDCKKSGTILAKKDTQDILF